LPLITAYDRHKRAAAIAANIHGVCSVVLRYETAFHENLHTVEILVDAALGLHDLHYLRFARVILLLVPRKLFRKEHPALDVLPDFHGTDHRKKSTKRSAIKRDACNPKSRIAFDVRMFMSATVKPVSGSPYTIHWVCPLPRALTRGRPGFEFKPGGAKDYLYSKLRDCMPGDKVSYAGVEIEVSGQWVANITTVSGPCPGGGGTTFTNV
jgi:hypothetical protein